MKWMVLVFAVLTQACGSSDRVASPVRCAGEAVYVDASRAAVAGYDRVSFHYGLAPDCAATLSNGSGNVRISVGATYASVSTRFLQADFGGGRTLLDGTVDSSVEGAAGSFLYAFESFGYQELERQRAVILPWNEDLSEFRFSFLVLEGVGPEYYPSRVRFEIEATDLVD